VLIPSLCSIGEMHTKLWEIAPLVGSTRIFLRSIDGSGVGNGIVGLEEGCSLFGRVSYIVDCEHRSEYTCCVSIVSCYFALKRRSKGQAATAA
jgi:hypothetical protein